MTGVEDVAMDFQKLAFSRRALSAVYTV